MPTQFNKQSIAIATGTIISRIRYENHTTRFTLKNADGLIYIKAPLHLSLKKNDPVSVIGYLASHHHQRCGSHLFVQALMVLTADYPKLWDDIGIPALLRTVHALENATGKDE